MIQMMMAMVLLGAITYFYRFSFLSHTGSQIAEKIPPRFLKLLGPATFTAIIANNLVSAKTTPETFHHQLIVTSFALVVAHRTKSILMTLIFGLTALYFLENGILF